MDIRDYARQVLLSQDLSEKLALPNFFDVGDAGEPLTAPPHPGRPANLRFSDGRARFPRKKEMVKDEGRGRVLHFFANHELLAMELMALAILKFPRTPPAFRLGLAKTMAEERSHMQLYLKRMQELGVGFGEVSMNGFFWRHLHQVDTPVAFVTAMALTFEQANLDFCTEYRDLFREIGDETSAEIMNRVLQEEIGHVKHGWQWFKQWHPASPDLWTSYKSSLSFPLSPRRAKGRVFQRDARLAAGLPDFFIDELEVYQQSKDRPGAIFFFNPHCEAQVARGSPGFGAPTAVSQMVQDLSAIQMFIARPNDTVLLRKRPRTEYLLGLVRTGFALPEFLETENTSPSLSKLIGNRRFDDFYPWGWSPDTMRIFAPAYLRLENARLAHQLKEERSPTPKDAFSKVYAQKLRLSLAAEGNPLFEKCDRASCHDTLAGVLKAVDSHARDGAYVIKAPFGTSGRNQLRLDRALLATEVRWVEKVLSAQGTVLVEAWVDRIADFGLQLEIFSKHVAFLGVTRFVTTTQGQHRAHILGKRKFLSGLPDCLDVGKLLQAFRQIGEFSGDHLRRLGHLGRVGIDTFLYRDSCGRVVLRPIVEINPRTTMGHIALALERRIQPGSCAIWRMIGRNEIAPRTFGKFAAELSKQFPLKKGQHGYLKDGVLFTNDPLTAKIVLGALAVGKTENADAPRFLTAL